jgi:uncharacterized cupin superfamily protein
VQVVPEARLEQGVPQTEGWFVVNARETSWQHNELGAYCGFEGPEARFAELGINLNVLAPGVPMAMYHEEEGEEAFLVLRGECLLIVEGEERPLRAWDFVFCPPWTKHVIVGAGDGPALVLAAGARGGRDAINYPVDETAIGHRAGVETETTEPAQAYTGFSRPQPGPPPADL